MEKADVGGGGEQRQRVFEGERKTHGKDHALLTRREYWSKGVTG